MPPYVTALMLLGSAYLFGHGCASSQPAGQRLDRGFARIQVHEQAIALASARAGGSQTPCETVCEATGQACLESGDLCSIARELADADAVARCDDAEAQCELARDRAAERCPCGGRR
ncbi:MAG: hypothetical protein OEZ06_18490 [Myxococcales bacterium]|nr:hypothetical protein [Myxococcales bacterium]